MEKKKLAVIVALLVAVITLAVFLTKDFWWSPIYYPGPSFISPGFDPEKVIGAGAFERYTERVFTAENASSEYPEPWLVDKNLLKGYSRFYSAIWLIVGSGMRLVDGPNNQPIIEAYVFRYESEKIAKKIYHEKSSLEDTKLWGNKVKHGPNKYVWQSNEFIVYIASAEGFESTAKETMNEILQGHTPE